MKYLLPVLLLASLGLAQIFGPAGVPLSWDFGIEYFKSDSISASKLTSPSATSYLSMDGDTLFFTLTGASADRDMYFVMEEEDGTKHVMFYYDEGFNYLTTNMTFRIFDRVYANYMTIGAGDKLTINFNTGEAYFQTRSNEWLMRFDPNFIGSGTVQIGQSGDSDTLRVYGDSYLEGGLFVNGNTDTDTLKFDSWYGLVRYVDSDYTATATDWQICVEDTARITLPALSIAWDSLTANTGQALQLDIWASTDACTISTVADSIWGNAEIVLSPGDNASLRAGRNFWIVR